MLTQRGGLEPVGDFYSFQARVVSIPAIFLAVWSVLIPLVPRLSLFYHHWREPYLALLVPAVLVQLLAFFYPLLWFHREMMRQKTELLSEADALSVKILEWRDQLADADWEDESKLKERIDGATQRYSAIEHLKTWPVDTRRVGGLALRTLTLLFPYIPRVLVHTPLWPQLLQLLARLGQ
jgi:hypothetical protein